MYGLRTGLVPCIDPKVEKLFGYAAKDRQLKLHTPDDNIYIATIERNHSLRLIDTETQEAIAHVSIVDLPRSRKHFLKFDVINPDAQFIGNYRRTGNTVVVPLTSFQQRPLTIKVGNNVINISYTCAEKRLGNDEIRLSSVQLLVVGNLEAKPYKDDLFCEKSQTQFHPKLLVN